ncbi:MAG TPA: hypothetical protein VNE61_17890, partial [Ktedonobacteraceae bacterium]|nr:hypothetical protein [Ktedonobacteraceae bacterium]
GISARGNSAPQPPNGKRDSQVAQVMDSHGNEFRRGVGLPRPCFYAKRSDGGRGKPTPLRNSFP